MMHLLRAASTGHGPAQPNLRTYNAAISALCRVGHLTRALRLEHEMVSIMKVAKDVQPHLQSCQQCPLQNCGHLTRAATSVRSLPKA